MGESCARQSFSENVSILASAANCYIGTAARGILLSIAKCDQMTAQERQRNRPLRPLDAEVWSSRSSLATSVGDRLYRPKDFVDQRLGQREQTTRPSGHGVVPPTPRAGTARTADRPRSTNRLSTRS